MRAPTRRLAKGALGPPDNDSRFLLDVHTRGLRAGASGCVTPEGVRVPLRLRHHMLADLIAVRRPSATAALSELARDGLVQRDGAGLLLHGDVLEAIDHLLDERVT